MDLLRCLLEIRVPLRERGDELPIRRSRRQVDVRPIPDLKRCLPAREVPGEADLVKPGVVDRESVAMATGRPR
jgi:hypothetical protein